MKINYKTLSALLFFGFGIITVSFSQQYYFKTYSLKEGLVHSQVETLFQARNGYLWIGTIGGLSRFDGIKFENISTDDGLLDNQINDISQDSDGNLWFATLGGISKYDGNKFINYPFNDSLRDVNVKELAIDKYNRIWMALGDEGFAMFYNQNYSFYHLPDNLSDKYVRTLCLRDKALFLGTKNGVVVFQNNKFSQSDLLKKDELNISRIYIAKNNTLIITSYGKGIYIIGRNDIKHYDVSNGLNTDWVRDVVSDDNSDYWFVSKYGLCKISNKTGEVTNFTQTNGLNNSNLNVILKDNEGHLWLGSDGGGFIRFSGEKFVHFTKDDGLGNNIVMSIIQDTVGRIWCSTYGNGLCSYFNNKFTCYTTSDGIANNTVWSSIIDQKGTLWFGTSEGITSCRNARFNNYTVKDGLIGKKVISLLCDKEGRIWYGTKEGVAILKKQHDNSLTELDLKLRSIGKNVRAIAQTDNKTFWFGSSEGLFKLNNDEIKKYTENDGLSDNTIYSIYVDKNKNLWLGTKNGITFYNNKNFRIIRLGKEANSNFINFVIADNSNVLWAGTNNGIFTIDLNTFYSSDTTLIRQLTSQDGIVSQECNLNAAYVDASGNAWFGTNEGLVMCHDARLDNNIEKIPPYIQITGLRLNLEETDWSKYSSGIKLIQRLPANLQLKYRDNHLTFDFNGISLSNPEQVRYKFKLEGFDEKWSPSTSADFATYSNLPFGHYNFVVKACNQNAYWSEITGFEFEILPPFWRTWMFYTGLATLLIGLAFLLYKWRMAVISRKEYTRHLIHQSKLLALEHQTLNASMNRHFVFNALNSIQYYINKQDKLAANNYLSGFAKLIRKNLDSSQNSESSLGDEIERLQLYLSLEKMRFKDKFEYSIVIDKAIDADSTSIPAMLLQPYVENSISHGILPMKKKGKVEIAVTYNHIKDCLVFRITDNGIGINNSKLAKEKEMNEHVSKGMDITKRRINLLREINNNPMIQVIGPRETHSQDKQASGTIVEIVLPLIRN